MAFRANGIISFNLATVWSDRQLVKCECLGLWEFTKHVFGQTSRIPMQIIEDFTPMPNWINSYNELIFYPDDQGQLHSELTQQRGAEWHVFFTSGCSTVRFTPSFYHVLPKPSKPTAEAKIPDMTSQRSEPTGAAVAVAPTTSASAVTALRNTGKGACRWQKSHGF